MLELGNEVQVRNELEGKSGFDKGIEDELIRRIAAAEVEEEQYERLGIADKICFVLMGAVGVILAVIPLV